MIGSIIRILLFLAYLLTIMIIGFIITLNTRKFKEVYKIDSLIVYLIVYLLNVICCFFIFGESWYNITLTLSSAGIMFTVYYFSKLTIIALTGGIACGKSTISKFISEHLKLPVIDTDILARRVVEPGRIAYKLIVTCFGVQVINEDKSINRNKLGEIIFKNKSKRMLLNLITHPAINLLMFYEIISAFRKGNNHIVVEVPLLFETKIMPLFSYPIITVYVTEPEIQKERLMIRNGFTEEEANRRINSQMPLKEKIKRSHIHLCNDTNEENMKVELMQKLPPYFSF